MKKFMYCFLFSILISQVSAAENAESLDEGVGTFEKTHMSTTYSRIAALEKEKILDVKEHIRIRDNFNRVRNQVIGLNTKIFGLNKQIHNLNEKVNVLNSQLNDLKDQLVVKDSIIEEQRKSLEIKEDSIKEQYIKFYKFHSSIQEYCRNESLSSRNFITFGIFNHYLKQAGLEEITLKDTTIEKEEK